MNEARQALEDELDGLFGEEDEMPHPKVAEQLSHEQMLILAEGLARWALDLDRTFDQAIDLLGMSRGMIKLANEKGEDWAPPEPEKLSLLGFLARQFQDYERKQQNELA